MQFSNCEQFTREVRRGKRRKTVEITFVHRVDIASFYHPFYGGKIRDTYLNRQTIPPREQTEIDGSNFYFILS